VVIFYLPDPLAPPITSPLSRTNTPIRPPIFFVPRPIREAVQTPGSKQSSWVSCPFLHLPFDPPSTPCYKIIFHSLGLIPGHHAMHYNLPLSRAFPLFLVLTTRLTTFFLSINCRVTFPFPGNKLSFFLFPHFIPQVCRSRFTQAVFFASKWPLLPFSQALFTTLVSVPRRSFRARYLSLSVVFSDLYSTAEFSP